ncbi:unnamed protein product [Ectocarpus fasciculatus]
MFFIKKLRRDIQLNPKDMGSHLKEKVKNKVMDEIEGTCLGKYGYVVSILEIRDDDIQLGLIDNDTGAVNITVWYSAILLRPFPNEVVDAIVTTATETGFFSRVGPLQVFVSRHAMHEDITFNYAKGDCWCSEDQEVEITEGSIVRLRIMGVTVDAGAISAIGTIKDNFLGLYG